MSIDLESLRIGPLEISPPVVLAPLAGYTDLPYRLICRRQGAPYCTTEMMLDKQLSLPGKLRRRLVHICDEDHPVAGQIIGSDPAEMAAAAGELCKSGFDVVDLNFACPARKVLARGRGGSLMKDPARALEIVRAVIAAADRPVTVKLRMAFDGEAGDAANFWRIAEGAFDAGAAGICVHGRTVVQRFTGEADWEFLARVAAHFAGRTVIGSGDTWTPAEAVDMIRRTGASGAAFGRAAIGNPWIFRQLGDYLAGREPYQPPLSEQREVIGGHFAHAVEVYGPHRGPRIMRKFGIKYARCHPTPAPVRAAFIAVKRPHEWQTVLDRLYTQPAHADRTDKTSPA